MRLLIVAECEHFKHQEVTLAPGHFRREMDLWSRMFDRVEIITSFPVGEAPAGLEEYESTNIDFLIGNGAFSSSVWDKLLSVGRSLVTALRIGRSLARCDVVHIRCPSRNGLLALLAGRIWRRPQYVKWAGEWPVSATAPWSWRRQAAILLRLDRQAVVTVYSRRETDPRWIHETETTSLTEAQIREVTEDGLDSRPDRDQTLLWVGRLSRNKKVPELIRSLDRVFEVFPDSSLEVVGDGPDRSAAESEARRLGLGEKVHLRGNLDWQDLRQLYSRARLLLLPSGTEGFPKVVHEAALFGTPAVVFAVGALPRIVKDRGVAVEPPGDFEAFGQAVCDLLADRELQKRLSESAAEWAAGLSLERVVDRYRALCEEAWNVNLAPLVDPKSRPDPSE